MNLYIVFDHYYSGIIQSQVIDLVRYLKSEFDQSIRIIAFVNLRRYTEAKRKYKQHAPEVLVLPNFGFDRWKWVLPILLPFVLVYRPKKIIGRSMFATQIALVMRFLGLTESVVYDGRGAEYAEWSEYFFQENEGPLNNVEVKSLEYDAVNRSDQHLAVSSALVDYWENALGVERKTTVQIIPSTLANSFNEHSVWTERCEILNELNFPVSAVVFVFSGASSDWHGLEQLLSLCEEIKSHHENAYFLLMTNSAVEHHLPENLKACTSRRWVSPDQVSTYLMAADYGLLYREATMTNRVASPVKFPEYLHSGLNVLVSEGIGDISDFVVKHSCGSLLDRNPKEMVFTQRTESERKRNRMLALQFFSKESHKYDYQNLFLN